MTAQKKIINGWNSWAAGVDSVYARRQWLLSKWEVFEGVHWSKEKIQIMLKSIQAGLKLSSAHSLIDLGCGGGWILSSLKPFAKKIIGLDSSLEMLNFAKKETANTPCVCAEVGKLPLTDVSFDRALCYFVLLNISDERYVEQSLKEIYRILKPGGRALIGQMPDKNGSKDYDAAKADYLKFCEKEYSLGRSIREVYMLPVRLFDRKKLEDFLNEQKIPHQFLKSFNPFYHPEQPELVSWRFDLVLEKP